MMNSRQIDGYVRRDKRVVAVWLCICLLLVASMVLVGGYTRLSGSGLSITEWKPIHGVIPPIGEAEWDEEFQSYRASPQYEKVNKGMTLEEFKVIYWPEYFHRLLGRLIGFVFLFPLLVFAARRSITRRFGLRLTAIFALGGLQGAVGWLMVASGLVDSPYVSPIRLAVHLSLAFAIFALILWALLDIVPSRQSPVSRLRPATGDWGLETFLFWFTLLCLQIILGALVAGMHAGLVYNTWPSMNGQFMPDSLISDGVTMVQFLHRKLAIGVAVLFIFWWYWQRLYVRENGLVRHVAMLAVVLAVQFALGVLTLLHAVPLPLALAHQMTALLLFAAATHLLHGIKHTT